jgi:hypothetical protein
VTGVFAGGFRHCGRHDAAIPESLRRNVAIPSFGMGRHSRDLLWYANRHDSVSHQHGRRIFIDSATRLVPMEIREHIYGPDSGRVLSGSYSSAGYRFGDETSGLSAGDDETCAEPAFNGSAGASPSRTSDKTPRTRMYLGRKWWFQAVSEILLMILPAKFTNFL